MASGLEYVGVSRISGPIIIVENVRGIGYDELVEIITPSGETRLGKVLEVSRKAAVIQVFEGTTGLSPSETRVRFLGKPLEIPVSTDMLGRIDEDLLFFREIEYLKENHPKESVKLKYKNTYKLYRNQYPELFKTFEEQGFLPMTINSAHTGSINPFEIRAEKEIHVC